MKAGTSSLVFFAILTLATGCQTFSMTEADFEKQQHGQPVDPETGAVVGLAGTAAYIGAAIGALAAGRK
jgi:hypothetical protein